MLYTWDNTEADQYGIIIGYAKLHYIYFTLDKLTLTSPTGGGRSVGIVRSRTKATEFSLV
jgi:hypothetical protein